MPKRRAHGEGTLYKRADGRWCAQITLPDGRRRTKYGKTKQTVVDWMTAQRAAIRSQTWVADERITLGEFMAAYLKDVAEPSVRPRTLQSYHWLTNKHITPALGHVRLSRLSAPQVQAAYTDLLKRLSPTTVLHIHNLLHRALEQARRWGLVAGNVTDLVEPPAPRRAALNVWDRVQAQKFLETVESHRLGALFILALYTGMRLGELMGLQVADVDLRNGVLFVQHALTYVKGEGHRLTEPKSKKGKRLIKLPAPAWAALERHMRKAGRTSGFVFTTVVGTPLWQRNLHDEFEKLIEAAGVPRIRFHDLRHTCASLHLAAGTHPKVVQDLLGHSTISLTLDTYSHILPGMQEDAAVRLGRLLDDGGEPQSGSLKPSRSEGR